jgi:hypothetical protein
MKHLVGLPIQSIKYRFNPETTNELLKINRWDFEPEKLKDVDKHFFNTAEFINKYKNDDADA